MTVLKNTLLPVILISVMVFAASNSSAQDIYETAPALLRGGFVLNGITGSITRPGEEGKWFFVPDEDITDGRGLIQAGQMVELLASSTLMKMTTIAPEQKQTEVQKDISTLLDLAKPLPPGETPPPVEAAIQQQTAPAKKQNPGGIKLWARVTKYQGKNFLFPYLFVPMDAPGNPQTQDKTREETQPDSNVKAQPDKDSIIPSDIMAKLKPKRVVNLARLKDTLEVQGDAMLVDRAGFLIDRDGSKIFSLNAFGRNIENLSFQLLPNTALEQTEYSLTKSNSRQRYRIAGIITQYEGNYYMLLQRAARTYAHGNFAR